MYIAILDDAPDYMVPTLVAHSILNAHQVFRMDTTYGNWYHDSFRKVVVRVSRKEYNKMKETLNHWEGHENTICNGEGSCLVMLPIMSDAVPNVLKFAKLWKPKEV